MAKVIPSNLVPLLFLFVFAFAMAPTQAAVWKVRDKGEFTFEVSFEGVGTSGQFTQFDVALKFDPKQLDSSLLQVSVNLAAADMGDPEINEIIADPVWFDAGKFPRAVFKSTRIEARGPGKFVATGVLDLKGKRKEVTVPFSWSEKEKRADMRGEFIVQRIAFDVGSGEWAAADPIGIDVKLQFNLSLERGN